MLPATKGLYTLAIYKYLDTIRFNKLMIHPEKFPRVTRSIMVKARIFTSVFQLVLVAY